MFDLIRNLKKGGRGIIYITHRIPEVYAITDRVTVLRDGQVVASKATNEVSPEELIDMIAGRRLADELMHPVHGVGLGARQHWSSKVYPSKENCTTSISLSTVVKSLAWRGWLAPAGQSSRGASLELILMMPGLFSKRGTP